MANACRNGGSPCEKNVVSEYMGPHSYAEKVCPYGLLEIGKIIEPQGLNTHKTCFARVLKAQVARPGMVLGGRVWTPDPREVMLGAEREFGKIACPVASDGGPLP